MLLLPMDLEEQPPLDAPHGPLEIEAGTDFSESETPNSPRDTTKSDDHSIPIDEYELAAIELYCQVLLSRAHILFFRSIREGGDFEANIFSARGKDILEEAESYFVTGRYAVSDRLIAKWWYIRGFLSDIGKDQRNATRCLREARALDPRYANFKRVDWYLNPKKNGGEGSDEWSPMSRPSPRVNMALFNPDRPSGEFTRPPSLASDASHDSSLFHSLRQETRKSLPKDIHIEPKTPTQQTPHRSSIRASTPSDVRRMPNEVDIFIQKKMNEPSKATKANRKPSEETRRALHEHEYSPDKDAFVLATKREDERRAQAEEAKYERMRKQVQEMSAERYRRPSRQETLLTDTPSIIEEAGSGPANGIAPVLGSPIVIDTREGRRLSLSPITSASSGPSSPLRESLFPGDRGDSGEFSR
jgi:hypothetical protein